MAAVINMRVAAGGGEVNHGPARGAARREKGGSWWQAGRAQPPGGQARSHFPTINTQPCWPGRAGLGWAGLGWCGGPLSACVSPPAQPAQPAAILPVTAAPPSALLHNLLHPGVWLLRPRRGPSWLPAPAAEEGSYQGSLGPVLGPRLELGQGGEQVIVEKCDTAPHTALPAWPGRAHFHILNSQFYMEIGRKWIITVGPSTVPNNHQTEG